MPSHASSQSASARRRLGRWAAVRLVFAASAVCAWGAVAAQAAVAPAIPGVSGSLQTVGRSSGWFTDGARFALFQSARRVVVRDTEAHTQTDAEGSLPAGCGLDQVAGPDGLVGCAFHKGVPTKLAVYTSSTAPRQVAAWPGTHPVAGFGTHWVQTSGPCPNPDSCQTIFINWRSGRVVKTDDPQAEDGYDLNRASLGPARGKSSPPAAKRCHYISTDVVAVDAPYVVYINSGLEHGPHGLTVCGPKRTVLLDRTIAPFDYTDPQDTSVRVSHGLVTWTFKGKAQSYAFASGQRETCQLPHSVAQLTPYEILLSAGKALSIIDR